MGPKTTIRMEPELRAEVDAWAEQQGLELGAAVRSLLRRGLAAWDEDTEPDDEYERLAAR